jgi:carbonic anhydrase
MPAVRKSADEVEGEANSTNKEFVAKTVENNVKLTMDRIREKSQILMEMEDNGEIKIVGGVYSLQTGKVNMI